PAHGDRDGRRPHREDRAGHPAGGERLPHRARDVPGGTGGGVMSQSGAKARFGSTELTGAQARTLARAVRLEKITLGVLAVTVAVVALVAGQSQAMKVAWIEDSLSFLPPLAFLVAVRVAGRRP